MYPYVWETGPSVPDAEILARIAELLETPVSELLGDRPPESRDEPELKKVADQLAILNDRMADQSRRRRRILKAILIGLAAALILSAILYAAAFMAFRFYRSSGTTSKAELNCTLNGREYLYSVTYDGQYRIVEAGGDQWIADHVLTERYSDANVLMAQIEDYFAGRGGTCEIIRDK